MLAVRHQHVSRKIGPDHPLAGKTVYIPAMAQGSVEAFASVFHWLGVEAAPTPDSNDRTRELGAKFTAGDECYPAKVTVGDFLRILEQPTTPNTELVAALRLSARARPNKMVAPSNRPINAGTVSLSTTSRLSITYVRPLSSQSGFAIQPCSFSQLSSAGSLNPNRSPVDIL